MGKFAIDEDEAAGYLDSIDKTEGVNIISKPSLGEISSPLFKNEVSSASQSPWRKLNLDKLPSKGLFYPENTEITIRSAYTKEIRHWSTIDADDPNDVRECINWIIDACIRFRINGDPRPRNYNDFCEVDKYHLLFEIHELTFPNQENKLWAKILCGDTTCNTVSRTHVTTANLKGFVYPSELMEWYSEKERCFILTSDRIGEPIRLYLPTIGVMDKLRQRKKLDAMLGAKTDKSFESYGKYIFKEWRSLSMDDIAHTRVSSLDWNDSKFLAVHKATEMLEKNSLNKVASVCEKCKKLTESHIFLGGSFTVKDIFIISIGLNEILRA